MKKRKIQSEDPQILESRKKRDIKIQAMNDECELSRARAVTVGTAFGGTTEIMMRGMDGRTIWATLQPVEAMELVHQLAASIGCHIHIIPRQDFGSWRDWKISPEELAHYRGHQLLPGFGFPPHPNPIGHHQLTGTNQDHHDNLPGKPNFENMLTGAWPNDKLQEKYQNGLDEEDKKHHIKVNEFIKKHKIEKLEEKTKEQQ